MKKIYKIIFLFAVIFIVGILVTLITVNSSLNKFETPEKTLDIQKDTTYLLNAENKIV
jgi:uncharacterized protein YpmB|tara:strand:+ start:172 stop:345 length:174 start_codon:yes stop_codon:yes gene_type:complete